MCVNSCASGYSIVHAEFVCVFVHICVPDSEFVFMDSICVCVCGVCVCARVCVVCVCA